MKSLKIMMKMMTIASHSLVEIPRASGGATSIAFNCVRVMRSAESQRGVPGSSRASIHPPRDWMKAETSKQRCVKSSFYTQCGSSGTMIRKWWNKFSIR